MRHFVLSVLLVCAASAMAQQPDSARQLAREIYKELIEINTTHSTGDNTKAAEAMARRLRAAGFAAEDVRVLAPHPRKGNLVARLRGTAGGKPVLLLAHLDVVEALRDDWSLDPFTFTERDGFFYGRGTTDDKAMAAIWIANMIRYKQEGWRPSRDIIVALTADEEGGDHNGVEWLLKNHRGLIDAEFALNEGGGGQIREGKYVRNSVQASEKIFQSFRLESKNPGGHSSRPTKDNAIYHLAHALARVAAFDFPVRLNEVTSAYLERMSEIENGQLARDMKAVVKEPPDAAAIQRLSSHPYYNALLRTTCVATQLEGGHAENALPQTARAVVNCRILPNEDPAEIQRTLARVIANEKVSITAIAPAKPSPPSPLRAEVMQPIERITAAMWPGVPVVPVMSTGATDGLFLRNAGIPTYGVSGIFGDIDDSRAHGKDERLGVKQFYEGLDFLYRLVRELAR